MVVPRQVEVWQRVMGSIEGHQGIKTCGRGQICHIKGNQRQTSLLMVGTPYIPEY